MRCVLAGCLVLLLSFGAASAHDWNGIDIDGEGRLYVVDAEDGQVWRIDAAGTVAVHRKGIDERATCPHTHHVVVDAAGNVWLPSG